MTKKPRITDMQISDLSDPKGSMEMLEPNLTPTETAEAIAEIIDGTDNPFMFKRKIQALESALNHLVEYDKQKQMEVFNMQFNIKKMEKLISEDMALERMMNHFLKSNTMSYTNCLEIVFSSEVLCDSVMEERYKNLKVGE